jgi:hypothetical protein|tara:strand:+ start:3172 stop:3957 length:786 start_codon:yes stop_codon:yes gene_type:complete
MNIGSQSDFNDLIKRTLVSLDAIIFHHIKLHGNNIYSLLTFNNDFNLNNLISLLNSIIPHNILFNIYNNYNNYYIIQFKEKQKDEVILVLHLFTMNLINYVNNTIETYFDVNNIIINYFGYFIIPNYHNNMYSLTYENIIQRINNKKFCYISCDMKNFHKFLENKNNNLYLPISTIINKITYASKLVLMGWIMDEYMFHSWTINFYMNYKNYLNLIKLKNVPGIINKCEFCNKDFNLDDLVFNSYSLYIHYNCLFSYLYKK